MRRWVRAISAVLGGVALSSWSPSPQDTPKAELQTGLKDTEIQGRWIYDDLAAGLAEARSSGKPMMVVLRCVPCVTFKALDRQVARREDPGLASLMDKFVCVRVVQAWDLDLGLFQFDHDLNWAVFLMNADRVVYGRYATKCAGKDPVRLSTVEGLKKALEGALECHAGYPANRREFEGKVGSAPGWKTPQEMPEIQKRPNAKPANGTRQQCVHCHMIHEAEAWALRAEGKPVPDRVLWPYPLPDELGVTLDSSERATVTAVSAGTPADQAGLKPGDRILRMQGQPILSIADVQWVLHMAAEPSTVSVDLERAGKPVPTTLSIPAGWREKGDLSWRTLVWGMRHRLLGTEILESLSAEERSKLGLPEKGMALRIRSMPPAFVKDKNPDAASKLQKGDVIVEMDGRSDLSESGVLAAAMRKAAQAVTLTLFRGGASQKVSLSIP